MELRHLRHLMAVVEHGSFSRAAQAVHLTQPALTRSIQALEDHVGSLVLERNRGAIVPTDVGHLLLKHAQQLDAATRDLERDIALTRGLELGELRIGVGPYGGSALVGPVVGRMIKAHPGLHINLVLAPWQELPERARQRDVDLIVLELSQVQNMEGFGVQTLAEHRLVAVCRPGHPLTRKKRPTSADAFNYPLAGPSLTPAMSNLLRAMLPPDAQAAAIRRGLLAVECDLSSMLKDTLRSSDAVSFMPTFVVASDVAAGQLAVLPGVDLEMRARFGCAWLKTRTISSVALRFMQWLGEHDQQLLKKVGKGR